MKILLATNAYPPAIGGAEIACKRIADILSKEHEVTLITKKDGLKREKNNEKEIVELETKTIYSYMPKLKNFLEENEFDLYISFGFGKYFFDFIGDWCKKNRKKSISLPIGYFHTKNALLFKETYKHFFARNSLDNYDLLITATEQEKEFWKQNFKIKDDKIKVIPHTLEKDYSKFKPTNILKTNKLIPKQYIFYIGRLAKNKRPDLLIKAYSQIQTNVKLVIAGKDTKNEDLEKLANNNTLFLGSVSDDEKKELIKNARFCVFPSEYESYGLFIAEAAEFNTPIIASNIPAFKELIQKNEYLFENNEDSLKNKLKEFIKSPKALKLKKIDQEKEYLQTINLVATQPKKIKIFMQYPWIVADSPYYKYLFDYPPKNADYLNPVVKSKDVILNSKKLKQANKIKDLFRVIAITKNLPIPNARFLINNSADLVHSAHCAILTNKPWVVDFEGYWQIVLGATKNKLSVSIAKKLLEMNNCKKIMCWTNETKENLYKLTQSNKIKDKSVVVYPAVPAQKKVIQTKKVVLLFVARYFYEKGGDSAAKVMNNVTKKYNNVTGIIVSQTPQNIIEEYKSNKKLQFLPLMPREELIKKVYNKSSIFIYPGYSDSFGFALLEAMSFGLPIVTVDGISRTELVKENETGFVIKRKLNTDITDSEKRRIEEEMIEKTNILIKNLDLRKKMGQNTHNEITKGKFSIKRRNELMEKFYEEALL